MELTTDEFDLSKHNGMVTITNTRTNMHRTFKIHTVREGVMQGKRVVSLLIGSDRECDWQGFGFVVGGKVRVWKSKQGTDFEGFAKMLHNVPWLDKNGYKVQIEGCCQRCNRALTVRESIDTGYGRSCADQVGVVWQVR